MMKLNLKKIKPDLKKPTSISPSLAAIGKMVAMGKKK